MLTLFFFRISSCIFETYSPIIPKNKEFIPIVIKIKIHVVVKPFGKERKISEFVPKYILIKIINMINKKIIISIIIPKIDNNLMGKFEN